MFSYVLVVICKRSCTLSRTIATDRPNFEDITFYNVKVSFGDKLLNAKSIFFIFCLQYVLEHTKSSSTIIAQNVPVNLNSSFGILFKIFSKEEISSLLQLREVSTQIISSEKLTDLKISSLRTDNWQVSFQHKLHAKHWNAFGGVLS